MKVAYYPGCASHGIAKDVDIATQLIAKDLDLTLYIAAYPAFLYYAEFIGIVLLWIGFVDFRYLFRAGEVNKSVNG